MPTTLTMTLSENTSNSSDKGGPARPKPAHVAPESSSRRVVTDQPRAEPRPRYAEQPKKGKNAPAPAPDDDCCDCDGGGGCDCGNCAF